MLATNAIYLAALDSQIDAIYRQLTELDQRWDLSSAQKVIARSKLLWQAVRLDRRRVALPFVHGRATRNSVLPR